MEPPRHDRADVFATVDAALLPACQPIVTVQEDEGLTVVARSRRTKPSLRADEGDAAVRVLAALTLRTG